MSEFISKIDDHGIEYIIRDAAAAPIESPNLRGVPTAPTAAQETKNDQIATTAFVHGLINNNIDSKLGNPGGIATLDENGNIPSSQLPSYVDDVLDGTYDKENDQFLTINGEIYSPESSKIYIDVNTRVTYRWTGTTYAEIASSLALGTTAATAFPGNRGLALEQEVAALSLGAMTYRGTIGIDGDVTELPPTHKKGDVYLIKSDGEYAGKTCKKDDLLLCVRSNTVHVATLPRPDSELYIICQIYNPTDNTYGDIHFCHFWKSVYSSGGNFYFGSKWGYNQLEADYASRLYKTSNNGVSWTEYEYNERTTSIFAEPQGTTFKFLYSTVDIRDKNENVIFSANPFSLDGYNEDWTIIQGKLEDIVGEGAIYIDPDETSSEIENIDSVTSAKYVSYSNANSGLEATNVQEAIDETNSMAKAISKGKDISGKDLFYDLGAENETFIGYGTNMTGIPENESTSEFVIQQTCTDDKIIQFASAVNSNNHLYYRAFYKPGEFSLPDQWRNLSLGEALRNCFKKYNSTEAGTVFGVPGCGMGLYFFTIIESISSTDRSNPTFGTMYIDSNYQSWISFQKGTDSVITDIKYYDNYYNLAYSQMVITLSANRYISVFTLKLDGCCNESGLNKFS